MTLLLTQSEFEAHFNDYLDKVSDNDKTVYVTCSNGHSVAIISQEKLFLMEREVKARESSLEYAIARDQLIERGVLPDDKIVESNDEYWDKFK